MGGLLSFPFCGKRVILNRLGRIARSFELYAQGICFIRELIQKNCFKMEWVLPVVPVWTKSKENNGPNGQPAQWITPSEFYKIRYIQRYCIGKRLMWFCDYFCCGSTISHWWCFCLFVVKFWIFPGLVRSSRRPVTRSKKESLNFPGVLIRMM